MKTLIRTTAVLTVLIPAVLFAQSSTQAIDLGTVHTTQQKFFLMGHPEQAEKNISAYVRPHMSDMEWDILWTDHGEEIAANRYKEHEVPSDWPVHFISYMGGATLGPITPMLSIRMRSTRNGRFSR